MGTFRLDFGAYLRKLLEGPRIILTAHNLSERGMIPMGTNLCGSQILTKSLKYNLRGRANHLTMGSIRANHKAKPLEKQEEI